MAKQTNSPKEWRLLAERNLFAIRQAKAINAIRKMQEISVSLGNDQITLGEINAIIKDVRKKNDSSS